MAEQLGQVSRYRLLEPIGVGASGTVYKAAQLPSGRICALKLTGEGARHNKVAWRLAREFSVLSQLAHPNLVKVLDFGSDRAKGHYLVMEYVQGAPIGRFLARLRIEPFVAVLCQILDALSYLHSNGIVHQDLKPSHILIASGQQAEPVVKLIDLGMAFRKPKEGADEAYGGTAGYIAPELFCGALPDQRCDLYSLGAVLYEILTKRPAFDEADFASTVRAQLGQAPPDPSWINPGIPEWLSSMVVRLLSPDPADRFQSANALLAYIAERTGRTPRSSTTTIERPARLLQPAFTGRKEQLEILANEYRSVDESAGRSVLIVGEEGIGKSRLLREFGVKLKLQGVPVIMLDAASSDRSIFAEIVEQLRGTLDLSRRDYPMLQRLALRKHNLSPSSSSPQGDSPAEERLALFEEIREVIAGKEKGSAPVAWLIDDLDEAPDGFGEFVSFLRQSLDSTGCLLACTARPGPQKRELPVRPGDVDVCLEVGPLAVDETARLVASMFGQSDCPKDIAGRLAALAGGNPLFLQELTRWLARDGSLVVERGIWRFDEARAVECKGSDMLRDVVQRRLEGLGKRHRKVLEAATVLGPRFDVQLLRKALGAKRIQSLWPILLALAARGILVETEDGEFSFRHKLDRQIIYETIDEAQRLRLHLRAAKAIMSARKSIPEASRLIGEHFAGAGHPSEAVRWLVDAAKQALQVSFSAEAKSSLTQALSIWPEEDKGSARFWRAMHGLADCCAGLGQAAEAASYYQQVWEGQRGVFRTDEMLAMARSAGLCLASIGQAQAAVEWYARVQQRLGKLTGSQRAHLANSVGMAHYSLGDYESARSKFEEAASLSGDKASSELARALRNLSIVADAQGRLDEAIEFSKKAIAVAQRANDPREEALDHTSLGVLLARKHQTEAALEAYNKALEFFEGKRALEALACIYNNIGDALQSTGELDRALKFRRKAFATARRIDDKLAAIYAHRGLGNLHVMLGKWDEALRDFSESERIAQQLKHPREELLCAIRAGELLGLMGRIDEARQKLQACIKRAKGASETSVLATALLSLARAERICGAKEVALGLAKQAAELLGQSGVPQDSVEVALELAPLLAQRGEIDRAQSLLDESLKGSEDRLAPLLEARFLIAASQVKLMAGDIDGAKADASKGKQIAERAGAVFEQATAESLCAEAALQQGQADEAQKILQGTLRAFKQMGAKPKVKEIEQLLKRAKAMQAEEGRLRADLQLIYKMSQIFNSILDLDELLSQVMDYVLEKLCAQRGLILLKNDRTGELEVVIARNVDKQTIEDVSAISGSIVRRVISQGEPVVSTNAMDDPRFRSKQSIMLNKIRSLVCVPLLIRNEIVGTIYVDNRITAGLFSPEDVSFLTAFSNYVAMAIERAKMYEKLRRDSERLASENVELRRTVRRQFGFESILGQSEAMSEVFELMRRVVKTNATVLILGPSGTGKELVARAIHYSGPRRDKPFVKVNCATLPEGLLESELFGHEKGAYTGAIARKLGKFELAQGGTVFLDEIAEIKPSLQSKLLQVIEEKRFERVGGTKPILTDARILAATNRDLESEMRSGNFREDLYFRLSELVIRLPALKERVEDIPILARHFASEFANELGRELKGIQDDAMQLLLSYSWPGNVRELKNCLYRAIVSSNSDTLSADDIRKVLPGPATEKKDHIAVAAAKEVIRHSNTIANSDAPFKEAKAIFEGGFAKEALKHADNKIALAARRLGIDRKTFRRILKSYQSASRPPEQKDGG